MARSYQVGDIFVNETSGLENSFQAAGVFFGFTTPTGASANNWFYDARTQGWFRDSFANTDYNPMAVAVFDGDNPDDRVVLLGGSDGYIRKIDKSLTTDDGTAVESFIILGPLSSGEDDLPLILSEIKAIIDLDGNSVLYEVMVGDTPEAALDSEAATFAGDGTLAVGASLTAYPRERGNYIYIKIGTASASTFWALEKVKARISKVSSSRGRTRINDSITYPLS